MWKRGNLNGRLNLFFSHIDSTFSDHGIFRLFWNSWAKLPGDMYRSNQPYPFQIKRYIKKYDIKSILNLRGERNCSSYFLEKNFCDKNNIKLYNFPISSRDLPDKEKLLNFEILLNNIDYPCIMHCKSGADRAGLGAALYLIYKQKYSIEKASKQLTFKHLHIKYAKTGILDFFFQQVINEKIKNKSEFLNWITKNYDKKSLKQNYKTNTFFDFLINIILRRE